MPDNNANRDEVTSISVPLVWVGLDEKPVESASHFISQFHEDLFVLSVGMVSPPVILGTPEQRAEQAQGVQYVSVRPVARIGLTESVMRHLIGILQENLANYEKKRVEGS